MEKKILGEGVLGRKGRWQEGWGGGGGQLVRISLNKKKLGMIPRLLDQRRRGGSKFFFFKRGGFGRGKGKGKVGRILGRVQLMRTSSNKKRVEDDI